MLTTALVNFILLNLLFCLGQRFQVLLFCCCSFVTPALRCEHDWCMHDTERSARLQSWSSSSYHHRRHHIIIIMIIIIIFIFIWWFLWPKFGPVLKRNISCDNKFSIINQKQLCYLHTHTSPPRVECPNPAPTSVSWINHCCLIRSGAPRLLSDPCSAAVWTPPTTLYVHLPLTLTQ